VGSRQPAVRLWSAALAIVVSAATLAAQNTPLPAVASAQAGPTLAELDKLRNFLPIGPPASLPASAVPDLSGDWGPGAGGIGQSLSAADPAGRLRGKEPDIPYQPWALARTMEQVPPTGPDAKFEATTDPQIHYCEPPGPAHIFMYPAKTKFVQTPEAVYILHEVGPVFRVVWLNAKHPPDPDPNYWGHSVGWYENGDTLVVDTVGLNDRAWLDQMGHPRTEKLHMIERYRKTDTNAIAIEFTVDDPGAYTKPWIGRRNLARSTTGFMRYAWVCSVRDNYEHYRKVGAPGNPGATTFK
jgi:hypothetical protein